MWIKENYPIWVCSECALDAGGKNSRTVSTFHMNICPVCGKYVPVTEPRDFGYPKLKANYEHQTDDNVGERNTTCNDD